MTVGMALGTPTVADLERRPKLRGVLHLIAAPVFALDGLVLTAVARTTGARLACAVYAASAAALFATSATYHRVSWSPGLRPVMQRLDHSMIFVLIAGSYTPVAVLTLAPHDRVVFLVFVWLGAAAGVGMKWLPGQRPGWVDGALYISLGWLAVLFLPQFIAGAGLAASLLFGVGGLLYTLGALALATHRPDPWPRVFGSHEVWHAATLAAATSQAIGLWLLAV